MKCGLLIKYPHNPLLLFLNLPKGIPSCCSHCCPNHLPISLSLNQKVILLNMASSAEIARTTEAPEQAPPDQHHAREDTDMRQLSMQLERISHLLAEMAIMAVRASQPDPTSAIWAALIQVVGLFTAGLFGAFSILAWQSGDASNRFSSQSNCLASASNWLALYAMCQNAGFAGRMLLLLPLRLGFDW